MMRIELLYNAEIEVPFAQGHILDGDFCRLLKTMRMPIPYVVVKDETKISYNADKLPDKSTIKKLGENYLNGFNELAKDDSNFKMKNIKFLGISDWKEI